jgi:Bacterial Ig-like domain (group 2)
MRSQHVIIGIVSLALAACARLVPPDSIVALEGPQLVNVMVGATQPLKLTGTRGDGRTVKVSARALQFASSDSTVARVTRDGRVQGVRLGRTSISATLSTPGGPVSVNGIAVAVGMLVARK